MGGRVEGGGGAKGGRGNFLFEGGEKISSAVAASPGFSSPGGRESFFTCRVLGGLVAAAELVHFQGRPKGREEASFV